MQIIKGKSNGYVYAVSFWATLGTFFFLPSLFAFTVIAIAVNQGLVEWAEIPAFSASDEFVSLSMMAQFVGNILPIVLIIVIFRKLFLYEWRTFFDKIGKNAIIIGAGIIAILALSFVINFIYILLEIEGTSNNQELIVAALAGPLRPFIFVIIVFFAPFLEEMIFRKFLMGYLDERFRLPKWIIIGISAFVFAAIHVMASPSDWIFIFQYLALAIVITVGYVISGYNIYVPIAIHLLNNLISFLLII